CLVQLHRGQHQRERDQCDESPVEEDQAEHDGSAEQHADRDRDRQVAPGPAVVRSWRRVPGCRGGRVAGAGIGGRHQTSSSSASLALRISSTRSVCLRVTPSSAFSARAASSSPTSESFTSLSMASLAWRRALRTDTRASSALALASLVYSLRRSSVSSGSTIRTTLPSLAGLTPRSESRIAFSIDDIDDLSNGVMMTIRASGTCTVASCMIGVWAP